MQASELRIGNLTLNNANELFRVCWINDTIDDQLKPIQLSDRWLTDFGFMNSELEPYDFRGLEENIIIRSDGRVFSLCLDIFINALKVKELQYVHELQNLYYAITGEELKYIKN